MKGLGTLALVASLGGCSGGDFGAGDRKPLGDASTPEAGTGHAGRSGGADDGGGSVKSRGGGRAAGGASGAADGCIPQPCANDNATCGEVDDGCGGVAKCLHQCGTGETCDPVTRRCACHAADVCTIAFNACCTTTGACGYEYYGCNPVGVCTYTGSMCPPTTSQYRWQCPGLTGGPDPGCTEFPAIAAEGAPEYFCCPQKTYAASVGAGGAPGSGGATSTEPCGGPCPYQDEGAASVCPGKNLFIAMSCVSDKCVSNASEPNKNHWYCCAPGGTGCTKVN